MGRCQFCYTSPWMSLYILRKGIIETEATGEVVGVARPYIHLLGVDITDVIRSKDGAGIRKLASPHQETRLSTVPRQPRGFRRYSPKLLR